MARDVESAVEMEPPPQLSLLITQTEIWFGTSVGERVHFRKNGDSHDIAALVEHLAAVRKQESFKTRNDVEVAAEDSVSYATVVEVVDALVKHHFTEWGLLDPYSLTVRFKE